jgi:UDP-N-acetylmuramate dehydrogenase
MDIREQVPLAPLTTLGLGGPARWYAACATIEDLREALRFGLARHLRTAIMGGGSNLIVPDEGYDGLVIHMKMRGVASKTEGGAVLVSAAAGEPWDEFVAGAVEKGWTGVECLSGIPGLVGATPIQNVGAYGQEVADTIAGVEVVHRQTLDRRTIAADACGFDYRTSAFKAGAFRDDIVVGVTFRLRPGGAPTLKYPELQRFVESSLADPALPAGADGLQAVRSAVLQLRRRKSMVVDPEDPHSRSVGSFFTNPVMPREAFAAAQERWKLTGSAEPIPSFPANPQTGRPAGSPASDSARTGAATPDRVKVPAAWLVEHAGFAKGYRDGNVGISVNHALALVNYGGTTRALLALAEKIRASVHERFGIALEREPVLLKE